MTVKHHIKHRAIQKVYHLQRGDPEILKRGALYVDHHGWPAKKILGFRWSKKTEITLETIFLSIFSIFFPFFFNKILSIFQNIPTR